MLDEACLEASYETVVALQMHQGAVKFQQDLLWLGKLQKGD